jgi:hypothetical protein
MLSVDLCVPYGLFNGATGTIVEIIYLNEKRPEIHSQMLSWLNLKLTKVLPSFRKTAKLFQFFQLIEKLNGHATVATGNRFL